MIVETIISINRVLKKNFNMTGFKIFKRVRFRTFLIIMINDYEHELYKFREIQRREVTKPKIEKVSIDLAPTEEQKEWLFPLLEENGNMLRCRLGSYFRKEGIVIPTSTTLENMQHRLINGVVPEEIPHHLFMMRMLGDDSLDIGDIEISKNGENLACNVDLIFPPIEKRSNKMKYKSENWLGK